MSARNDMDGMRRLTDGQRACLAAVAEGRTSKEIAKLLSISPHTVDQRLRVAMHALGAATRFEAARQYRSSQQSASFDMVGAYQSGHAPSCGAYQRSVYQAPDVAGDDTRRLPIGSSDETDDIGEQALADDRQSVFGEARAAYQSLRMDRPVLFEEPDARIEARRNDLSPVSRLAWTMVLGIGIVLALSLLITVAQGLALMLGLDHP